MAPPASGAHGTCPACHTLDTPLDVETAVTCIVADIVTISITEFSQSMSFSEIRLISFRSEHSRKSVNMLCGQNKEILMRKQVVHIVTTILQWINGYDKIH
jgi:hypothetical protein